MKLLHLLSIIQAPTTLFATTDFTAYPAETVEIIKDLTSDGVTYLTDPHDTLVTDASVSLGGGYTQTTAGVVNTEASVSVDTEEPDTSVSVQIGSPLTITANSEPIETSVMAGPGVTYFPTDTTSVLGSGETSSGETETVETTWIVGPPVTFSPTATTPSITASLTDASVVSLAGTSTLDGELTISALATPLITVTPGVTASVLTPLSSRPDTEELTTLDTEASITGTTSLGPTRVTSQGAIATTGASSVVGSVVPPFTSRPGTEELTTLDTEASVTGTASLGPTRVTSHGAATTTGVASVETTTENRSSSSSFVTPALSESETPSSSPLTVATSLNETGDDECPEPGCDAVLIRLRQRPQALKLEVTK